MPTQDEMTLNERRKYLKVMKPHYLKAKRQERSALLSEMERVTGMHRKSLTRLLHARSLERQKRRTPRARSYGPEVEEQLESISRATVGRILRKHRSGARRLPQKGAERANQVRHRSADGTHPLGHQRARAL